MAHANAEYNYGRMKVTTGAKEFAVRRNTLRRKAAQYNADDGRCPVTYSRVSAVGYESEKLMDHV
jgi:hypothetical protein